MNKKTLLVEIGTEELPAKELRKIAEELFKQISLQLNFLNLYYENIYWFATPRRLAIKVNNVSIFQPNYIVEKKGPSVKDAFNSDGSITLATKMWANNNKIPISEIDILNTNKGNWVIYRKETIGKHISLLLPSIINNSLKNLSKFKFMRWGSNDLQFIRPIHTISILLDDKLIINNVLGITSSKIIHGHRFMGDKEITLNHANEYPQILLKKSKVIADYDKRKKIILDNINNIAVKLGGVIKFDNELLEEVTSLVEWPVIMFASFRKEFLNIPNKILVYILQNNQKYFPLYDNNDNLLNKFIFVTNIISSDPEKIIFGNEKVLNARLKDVNFFLKNDRKKPLEKNLPILNSVVFHKQLGSLLDKTYRIVILTEYIAIKINANVKEAMRAGLLSKCDLITDMVSEFADIQGIVGMYYALDDGESENVANALKEQYKPRFTDDNIPVNSIACTLAIADKIDTIVGMFGIGQLPKGDKDPLALRRAAFGILLIIINNKLKLNIKNIIQKSMTTYNNCINNKNTFNNVIDFMFNRLKTLYIKLGYKVDILNAVMLSNPIPMYPIDFDARVQAISNFIDLNGSNELITANKRVVNCLSQSHGTINSHVNISLLTIKEEIELNSHLVNLNIKLKPYFLDSRYEDALIELINLKKYIDNFFDKVMINTDDVDIRNNRLTLLSQLRNLFLQIADLSLLQ
ncbi:MAG: glycine--tRNA ligase subunit beta [Pantoea sp. Brub]|nr:glycine--tRNA ligase subunit beta [Pantoea sp. Brub]